MTGDGDLVFRNGTVIDPANGRNQEADVRVSDGLIAAVHRTLPEQAGDRVIDASGMLVTPGLIDMHAHVAHTHAREHPLLGRDYCGGRRHHRLA